MANKPQILINKKDWKEDNSLLSTLIANKVDKDLYTSYLKLYKALSAKVNDWAIALDIASFNKYLLMIKAMYLNAWNKTKAKDAKALDLFKKLSLFINRHESMLVPKKGTKSRLSVSVKIEDLMNIANILGSAKVYSKDKSYINKALFYADICHKYINDFDAKLEKAWNKSMSEKPEVLVKRIKLELKK